MGSDDLKVLTRVWATSGSAPSPQPSPPMGEREESNQFMGGEDLRFLTRVGAISAFYFLLCVCPRPPQRHN